MVRYAMLYVVSECPNARSNIWGGRQGKVAKHNSGPSGRSGLLSLNREHAAVSCTATRKLTCQKQECLLVTLRKFGFDHYADESFTYIRRVEYVLNSSVRGMLMRYHSHDPNT